MKLCKNDLLLFHKKRDLQKSIDINALEGWKEYLSATNNGGRMNTKEVIVAVIDTGVRYDHEDLKDIMWKNPGEIEGNGIDDDGNGFVDDVFGINTITNSSDPMDVPGFRAGHGTHCAGIIAAKENNGKGIAGLASYTNGKVKIMALKAISDGLGYSSSAVTALEYALSKGAKVSSNSYGGFGFIGSTWENLKDVLEKNPNHLFVTTAGNYGVKITPWNLYNPCATGLSNVLCVGSTNIYDSKAETSSYGKNYVHVFAPGHDILSTHHRNTKDYVYKSGTRYVDKFFT